MEFSGFYFSRVRSLVFPVSLVLSISKFTPNLRHPASLCAYRSRRNTSVS